MKEYVPCPLSPIAADGWLIILAGVLVFFIGTLFYKIMNGYFSKFGCLVMILSAIFVLFSIWFFRDPSRKPDVSNDRAKQDRVILSAADGTVLKVERVNDARYGAPADKISIFMSPFNVHVNRSPIEGVIERVEYVPGKFFVASLDKASLDNERNLVLVRNAKGQKVAFIQIAGLIARRIVCRVVPGDHLQAGQRYGMIRFGSRMEMFVPVGSEVSVKPGDKLFAGQSIVGYLP